MQYFFGGPKTQNKTIVKCINFQKARLENHQIYVHIYV